jgi:hypothetical protein
MKSIMIKETIEREVEILPCVKCGSNNIELKDCGYTTFNVAWGKCIDCGNEVQLNPAPWNLNIELLAKTWNNGNDPKILRHNYEQQIIEIQKLIDALPK